MHKNISLPHKKTLQTLHVQSISISVVQYDETVHTFRRKTSANPGVAPPLMSLDGLSVLGHNLVVLCHVYLGHTVMLQISGQGCLMVIFASFKSYLYYQQAQTECK